MKRWIAPLVALLVLGMLGVSGADAAKADKKKDKKDANSGVIQKIDGTSLTVVLGKGKKATTVTVSTNADTSVMLDGQKSDLSKLKVGEIVKLDATSGTVKSIDATSTAAKPKKEKKKKTA